MSKWIPDVCIFHNVNDSFPCPDGLAAAWVVSKKFKEINPRLKFVGMTYEQAKDRMTFENEYYQEKNIIIVDFSINEEIKELLDNQGCSLRIIDHHKSYLKDTLDSKTYDLLHQGKTFADRVVYQSVDKSYTFDSYSCGAVLTWRMLFSNEAVPAFLEIIRQNDIFDFVDEDAEAIHYGMAKLRRSFSLFDQLYQDCLQGDWELSRKQLAELGQPSIDKKLVQFEKILSNPKKFQEYLGIPIIVLNKSEMQLKSRIAKYANDKFGSPFTIILDKDMTKVRVKGKAYDLLDLFADYGAVGHSATCSFPWQGDIQGIIELIAEKLLQVQGQLAA